MSPQTFVFIGRSGCGKGTQSELLQKVLKEKDHDNEIYYLETGEEFRNFISTDGYSNKLAKKVQETGGLQPAFLAVWMWSNALVENLKPHLHLFVDGTPRKLSEAIIFTEAMKFYSRKPTVVYLNVSRKWSEDRLRDRHRSDDALPVIKARLDWFDSDVMPAVNYFENSADVDFLDVNGERTIEEIHVDIVNKLNW